MKFEISWTPDDKPKARRVDGKPLTDEDRAELKALLQRMERNEVCNYCGSPWTPWTNPAGKKFRVCWVCAKSA